MKPFHELMQLVCVINNDQKVARLLMVCPEYVAQWYPRVRVVKGKEIIEPGLEPSSGFISAALAFLGTAYPEYYK